MPSFETYKLDIQRLTPTPAGDAGQVLNDNFTAIADKLEAHDTAIATKTTSAYVDAVFAAIGIDDVSGLQAALDAKASLDYVDAAIAAIEGPDVSGKADKVVPATINNVAVLDADGNLADGGVTLASKASAATVSGHISNTSNPHSVTAAQVGAYTTAAVDTLLAGKAATSHTHTIANVTGLQSALDGKLNLSGGTLTGALETPKLTVNRPSGSTANLAEYKDAEGNVLAFVDADGGMSFGSGQLTIAGNSGALNLYGGALVANGNGIWGAGASDFTSLDTTQISIGDLVAYDSGGNVVSIDANGYSINCGADVTLNNLTTANLFGNGLGNTLTLTADNLQFGSNVEINSLNNVVNINFGGGTIAEAGAVYADGYWTRGGTQIIDGSANITANTVNTNTLANASGVNIDGPSIWLAGIAEFSGMNGLRMYGGNVSLNDGSGSGGGTLKMDGGNITDANDLSFGSGDFTIAGSNAEVHGLGLLAFNPLAAEGNITDVKNVIFKQNGSLADLGGSFGQALTLSDDGHIYNVSSLGLTNGTSLSTISYTEGQIVITDQLFAGGGVAMSSPNESGPPNTLTISGAGITYVNNAVTATNHDFGLSRISTMEVASNRVYSQSGTQVLDLTVGLQLYSTLLVNGNNIQMGDGLGTGTSGGGTLLMDNGSISGVGTNGGSWSADYLRPFAPVEMFGNTLRMGDDTGSGGGTLEMGGGTINFGHADATFSYTDSQPGSGQPAVAVNNLAVGGNLTASAVGCGGGYYDSNFGNGLSFAGSDINLIAGGTLYLTGTSIVANGNIDMAGASISNANSVTAGSGSFTALDMSFGDILNASTIVTDYLNWVSGSLDADGLLLSGTSIRGANTVEQQSTVYQEMSSQPGNLLTAGSQCQTYMKGDKFIIKYTHGATTKFRYLDLTSTDATWTYTTTAP